METSISGFSKTPHSTTVNMIQVTFVSEPQGLLRSNVVRCVDEIYLASFPIREECREMEGVKGVDCLIRMKYSEMWRGN